MVTDTISDMLTRIRNATMVKHQIVQIPVTKMSTAITTILKEEGFIADFENYQEEKRNYLLLSLKYQGKSRILHTNVGNPTILNYKLSRLGFSLFRCREKWRISAGGCLQEQSSLKSIIF